MKEWKHLTYEQRKVISSGIAHQKKAKHIAESLGVDPTAVSKEVKKIETKLLLGLIHLFVKKTSKWTMFVQIMTEEQAKNHYENPFDITKIWPHKEFPLIEVGVLELNRNPENYFAEVEQAAFTPAHVVPGIGFSPDRFLQRRLFSYGDAQRYRLGVNHNHIPVNRAHVDVNEYHRDGAMRTDGNYDKAPAYTPNSQGFWTAQPEVSEPPLEIEGSMWRYDPKDDPSDDNFRAGGNLWRILTEDKKQLLIENTADDIASVTDNVKYRHAVHCYHADKEYGERITKAMKLNLDKVKELAKLDNNGLINATLSEKM